MPKVRHDAEGHKDQSVSLYPYSTVPYSTASCKTHEKLKIQYRTQYSRNTANTAEHSEFRVIVPVFTRVQHCTVHVQYRDFALYGTVLYFQILDFEIDPVL